MKKLCFALLAMVFCLNSFAATGVADDFARLVDDYQYSLTVDWDQKDSAVEEKLTTKFFLGLDQLTKEKGLKIEELEKMISSKVKDPKVLEAIRVKIALMGKNPSQKEVLELLKAESKNLYHSGASWNGEAVITYGFGILIVALFAYAIYFELTHECVRYEENDFPTCRAETDYGCDSFGRNCGTVYTGRTVCDYESVCVEYVKK